MATTGHRQGLGAAKKPDRERARAIKVRQGAIGRELRRVYDDVAQEAVPQEFLDLLGEMDARKTEREGEDS